ncbi:hypothetical protein Terro_3145 [Terriglobus roseus DSM 18391]|uniref:Uncharacterized protein n=1 Tax=Terriglobus roseus (strain DSM 18391 / NRRL B-41598 / KBS 63) TaxID=926566 RepID=I3ZJF6_TERRK|nr:hypothetical protein Terro_3145 [Terriglobus roseus DSM 18391]
MSEPPITPKVAMEIDGLGAVTGKSNALYTNFSR